MQHATAETVRGNFEGAKLTFDGVTSSFFRRDDKFFVRTDGPDGKLADFEVKYTFGVEPLQQYLVELPGGRLQALAVSWDARPKEQGGQRWFRQYPEEKLDFRDELHWTRRAQNWNFMCADCHSSQIVKRYDADGFLVHSVKSCNSFSAGQLMILREVENRTGKPGGFIESDLVDPRYFSAANIKNRLESYFQMIEQKRSGGAR